MDMPTLINVLDGHGFADEVTADKVNVINDVYWDVCSREAWPFLEKSISLTFDGVNGNPSNWPTDVGQVMDLIDNVHGLKIAASRFEEIRDNFPLLLTSKGIAFLYYFLATQMYVHPIPDSTTTMLMLYEAIPTALTSTSVETAILIPPRWHSILWCGALAQLYDREDDPELSVKFEARYEKKIQLMQYQAFKRQIDTSDTIQITDYEDLFD